MYKKSSRMRVYTKRVSLHELLNMIEVGKFESTSFLRRPIRWNTRKKSHIVESIILGLPCEEVWGEEDQFGRITILSGAEFLKTLIDFRDDNFRLTDLRYLKELDKAYFRNLNYSIQDDLFEVDLNLNVLHHDSNPLLKCTFLRDLNKNKLGRSSNQEARNLSFVKAEDEFRKFAIYVYERFVNENKSRASSKVESFIIAFQEDLLLILLLLLIKNDRYQDEFRFEEERHHNNLRFESDGYDTDFVNTKLSFDDRLDIALDKLMMRINGFDDYIYDEMHNMFSQIETILVNDNSLVEHVGVMNRLGSHYRNNRNLIDVLFGDINKMSFQNNGKVRMLVKRINL
jgi:hypothetical protein